MYASGGVGQSKLPYARVTRDRGLSPPSLTIACPTDRLNQIQAC